MRNIFALQDSVTKQIVAALAPKLTAADRTPSGRRETTSIEAYDLVLRGVALIYDFTTKESNTAAREMFERAITLDPNYAKAYSWLYWTHFRDWEWQWSKDSVALNRAHEAA